WLSTSTSTIGGATTDGGFPRWTMENAPGVNLHHRAWNHKHGFAAELAMRSVAVAHGRTR
ncbi:MAG: hypothetical protein ACK6EB_22615, partial [Planctomyces sp.]